MKQFKQFTRIGIIFVLISGSLAHFLYNWSEQNSIVGLFTPVNESIWEHMKLLFFPMLLYSLLMIIKFRRNYPCIVSAICFGILVGELLIPFFYYAYTYILGKNIFILDISIFILSIVVAFWLTYKFTLSCRLKSYTYLLCSLMCILFVCFLVFTYHPPDAAIFEEPTISTINSFMLLIPIAMCPPLRCFNHHYVFCYSSIHSFVLLSLPMKCGFHVTRILAAILYPLVRYTAHMGAFLLSASFPSDRQFQALK